MIASLRYRIITGGLSNVYRPTFLSQEGGFLDCSDLVAAIMNEGESVQFEANFSVIAKKQGHL